ncbi:ATP-binding cassette domain-containing protein [candidate division TA06 bacterium]|uniref:ATP-binding cassette domain-containing protein n=1 Tax=candidate division TA06 bacterium TaxID=2250710 RepID=A0A523UMU0_UNCT6|nr:MAG: ATP-binding cassette domain-containing protein [candidate division TA06 bacterium]
MIDIENVTVVYRRKWIGLEDASLKVGKGEFVFLVGSSGAGKSTILRLIYLDIFPAKGQVTVLGQNTSSIRRPQIPYIRRKIGVIFQDFKLLKDRTVFDNVMFALEVTGSPAKKRKKKALEALNALGMVHRRNEYPFSLSGGEQQKVAIARALVREPLILLADEPTGNIDESSGTEIVELLKEINRSGTAVVMATHDLKLAESSPFRTVYMEKSRIVEK